MCDKTTQRWVINSSRRGIYKRLLHEHLCYRSKGYTHRELAESRIKEDCEAVEKVVDTVDNVFRNPWKGGELISLSAGIKATVEVSRDILDAKKRGEEASYNFVTDRCTANPKKDFFDPVKKLKLKIYNNLKHSVKIKKGDETIPLKMDRTLFARMAVLGQSRKSDLKTIFEYPLGPLPWCSADAFGLMRKTSKAQLFHIFENNVSPTDYYSKCCTSIYDGMAILQRFSPPYGSTFQLLAEKIFEIVLNNECQRNDVIFHCYREMSKNAERLKRTAGSEGLTYQNILPTYPIKSWNKFLSVPKNKTEVVTFLLSQWKTEHFRSKLGQRLLYVTEENLCWKISRYDCELVPAVESSHEEADTRHPPRTTYPKQSYHTL